jgi:fatty acid desaturase
MNSNSQHLTEREVVRALLEKLKPYFTIKPVIFYLDLSITGFVAWASLFLIQVESIPLIGKIILAIISYSAFYRGLMFIHEVVHFNKRVPGYKLMYNLIFGFPCRIPFFIHDPHRYHHLPNTFATAQDPEYAYFKGSGVKTLLKPFLVGFLSPFLLIVRFGILPLISWVFPKKWNLTFYRKASTIIVNPTYIRPTPSDEEFREARPEEYFCALFFSVQVLLINLKVIKSELILVWFVLMIIGAFVNVWRARIAHRYDNPGDVLSPLAQLRDSITVERKFLSFLWAPAGMQYHSLHHLAPQIPYYNLQAAHQNLRLQLDQEHPYSQTVITSPKDGFEIFYNTVINSQ